MISQQYQHSDHIIQSPLWWQRVYCLGFAVPHCKAHSRVNNTINSATATTKTTINRPRGVPTGGQMTKTAQSPSSRASFRPSNGISNVNMEVLSSGNLTNPSSGFKPTKNPICD
jgi:hypothetical protein